MQKKKGISLIVLVITIIVMVILAGAIILTLNNNGIINKASEAVEKTNLKQVQYIANLAWAEAYTDGVRTVEDVDGVKGFETRVKEGIQVQGIDMTPYNIIVTDKGVEVALKETESEEEQEKPTIDPAKIILEGATYTQADGTVLNAGETMPEIVTEGDIYTYGDYKYTYETSSNGWKVAINTAVTDKNQTEYGMILESINGIPVTNMQQTFYQCKVLTTVPEIPGSVTNMAYAFRGCTSLTTAPEMPSSVTNMTGTFYGCTSLTTVPEIPSNVTNMFLAFIDCTSLTIVPKIPNSVTNMQAAFEGCTSLTTVPEIPSNVTNMRYTFYDCKALTGTIVINADPTDIYGCLYNTKITVVNGSTTKPSAFLETKTQKQGIIVV